jgi:hypothetical protein
MKLTFPEDGNIMKASPFIFTFLTLSCLSAHAAQGHAQDSIKRDCMDLGKYRQKHLSECSKSDHPAGRLKLTCFELQVAAERCGESGKDECFKFNRGFLNDTK